MELVVSSPVFFVDLFFDGLGQAVALTFDLGKRSVLVFLLQNLSTTKIVL